MVQHTVAHTGLCDWALLWVLHKEAAVLAVLVYASYQIVMQRNDMFLGFLREYKHIFLAGLAMLELPPRSE